MAQHDYVIANASGATVRADINNMALAISSNNSGSSAPSTSYAYLWWLDTSANVLKLRNSANSAWITMPFSIGANNTVDINGGTIDGTNIGASSAGTGAFTTLAATSFVSTGTVTATGTSVFASLDISGGIDVDGTTNLDVVDIDGTVNMSGSLTMSGSALIRTTDGTASTPGLRIGVDNDTGFYRPTANTIGFVTTGSERMRIDASGNLLVGATSGSAHTLSKSTASGGMLEIINSSTTAPSGAAFKFSHQNPNDGTSTFFTTADSSAYRGGWLSNGGIQNYQANNSNLSDRREKTNFNPAKSYLEIICGIPVQTYNYIDQNMEDDDSPSLGVVAQDVQATAPELVVESNWGTKDVPKMRLSIYQTDLQYALMKCIQEQQTLIESLTARITTLEG